ncbi:25245_t:CDS:2 [Cetraspora pellucida]|uniref:25245_t:CDS:1 n=1 Tax=Cetraspora pellucida TaxID=1433469 RepID=A0A9N9BDE2_9GLOM|nr:25245_t:CDS:2 [Cetraspora pellucida]
MQDIAKQFDTLDFSSTSRSSSHLPLINKAIISSVVRRVMWYPVLPIAQIFSGFTQTYYHIYHEIPYAFLLICFIGISLQGFLNALVFSQDIAVTRTFQAIKLQWWIFIVNSYESHYPHKSHNKATALVKSNDLNCNNADNIKSDIDNIIIEDINNKKFINKNNNVDNRANNSIVSQPSLLEWLRYMLLIKLFSPPKISPREISSDHLSSINSFGGNKFNAPSVLVDNQNGVQGSSIEPTKRISRISEEFEGIETTLKRL